MRPMVKPEVVNNKAMSRVNSLRHQGRGEKRCLEWACCENGSNLAFPSLISMKAVSKWEGSWRGGGEGRWWCQCSSTLQHLGMKPTAYGQARNPSRDSRKLSNLPRPWSASLSHSKYEFYGAKMKKWNSLFCSLIFYISSIWYAKLESNSHQRFKF